MDGCKKYQDIIPEYLDGHLSAIDSDEMDKHLNDCESCRNEVQEFEQLQEVIDASAEYEPSSRLRYGFEKMLEQEQKKNRSVIIIPKNYLRWGLQAAAAVLIFFSGFWFGSGKEGSQLTALRQEVAMTRQIATVAMMQQPSASKRLQAVLAVNEMKTAPDFEIIAALGNRLENDKQANVRLAAARALGKYGNQQDVRDILLHALQNQKDPAVQLTIIEVLVHWKEEKAITPFFELLQQDSLTSIVKVKAEEGIGILM